MSNSEEVTAKEAEPEAVLQPLYCLECDNEADGRCSVCRTNVCGSCFNLRHEWKLH